jgi:hypothetical protein
VSGSQCGICENAAEAAAILGLRVRVRMDCKLGIGIIGAGLVVGCASTPDVTYQYYPAKAVTTVTVTQTVDCDASGKELIVLNTASVTTAYMSDLDKSPQKLRIKDLGGQFADTDISVTWFDDGRLKSINQSSTGEGEAVIKAATSLIAAVAPIGGGSQTAAATPPTDACTEIKNWGGGKPVTLLYSKVLSHAEKLDPGYNLEGQPAALYQKLKLRLPILQVRIGAIAASREVVDASAAASAPEGAVMLKLFKTGKVNVDVSAQGQSIWKGDVTVPNAGDYSMPIPKSALFGKQTFSLVLSESGAVTTSGYGKNSGAAGALNALTSFDSTLAPSDAAKAAALKAQADLIAQQQRLARCQAQPDKCQ